MTRLGRQLLQAAALAAIVTGMGVGGAMLHNVATAQHATVEVPIFEVDPLWPKPLPNDWLLGMAIGVWVDEQDNIWIIHRSCRRCTTTRRAPSSIRRSRECCRGAPPVLAFDPDGEPGPRRGAARARATSGRNRIHGIHVDYKGNVWIGGNGEKDAHILKFTKDGKFLLQVGGLGQECRQQRSRELRPRGARSGSIRRPTRPMSPTATATSAWRWSMPTPARSSDTGAPTATSPTTPTLGHYDPNGAARAAVPQPGALRRALSNDGLLYVCDRQNDRMQVFKPDGKFVKEAFFAKNTLASGSTWDIAFSTRPGAALHLPGRRPERARAHHHARHAEELTTFGDGGRQPGQFYGVHSIAIDSKGNIYTTETYEGKRLQKFVFKGIGSVPAGEQGSLWPKRGS